MTALRDFVAELMEREGAAVENLEPDGLAVIAPPEVRAALGWPELARLGFGADQPAGAQRIGIEGEWLERFGELLASLGRHAERQIDCDPAADVGRSRAPARSRPRLAQCGLAFSKAVVDVEPLPLIAFGPRPCPTRSAKAFCGWGSIRAPAPPWATCSGGCAHPWPDQAWQAPDPAVREAAGPGWDAATLEARVRPQLDASVRAELAHFFARCSVVWRATTPASTATTTICDAESLRRLATLEGVEGPKADADRQRENQQITAIEHEYPRTKLGDLRHNYALRVTVDWIQSLELFVPVQRLEVLIRRRKGERVIQLDWHPLVRMAEALSCDWGPGSKSTRMICDERLHLTEPAGQDPCPGCAKPFCRACHPAACPRCGMTVSDEPSASMLAATQSD